MRYLTLLATLIFVQLLFSQQAIKNYVVVTIEKTTSSRLHPSGRDYWLVDVEKWQKDSNCKSIIPLYLFGYSRLDLAECIESDTLVLFNNTLSDSLPVSPQEQESQDELKDIIRLNSTTTQKIKIKWLDGYREKLVVKLTPISGSFNFCFMKHSRGTEILEYYRDIAVPKSNYRYEENFLKTQEFKEISRCDFSTLDFLSLQKLF